MTHFETTECTYCQGHGTLFKTSRSYSNGQVYPEIDEVTCPECEGTGNIEIEVETDGVAA
ncbi:hypothetical protein [Deinococcus misasensis]|uniref:hypothetical protein n=1 Tax=Deinococcus misasensis TaxID=392413 RepID=UPI00054E93EF|nr:hypothetical protein [Deinococcus misasensis]